MGVWVSQSQTQTDLYFDLSKIQENCTFSDSYQAEFHSPMRVMLFHVESRRRL